LSNGDHRAPSSAETADERGKSGTPMRVAFRGFSFDVLAQLSSSGGDLEETVKAAVRRYLADRALCPPGWQCLPLPDEDPARERKTALTVDLDKPMFEELMAEAAAQEVALDALACHAVMYAWAATRGPAQTQDGAARRRSAGSARSDRRSRT
jgi:hypothetical protein